jgi:flagellar motility protein MotE (MotC chaperone)
MTAGRKKIFVAMAAFVLMTTAALGYLGWGILFDAPVSDQVHAAETGEKPKEKAGEKAVAPTAKSETTGAKGEKLAPDGKAKEKSKGAIDKGGLELELMREVEKRQKALDRKDEELKQKEERIAAMQADLDKQLNELKVTQSRIEDLVKQRTDLDDTAVAKLAKTYSSMPPENAAALIRQMDPGVATRVISAMKEGKAARIIAALPPDIATKLSETMIKKK